MKIAIIGSRTFCDKTLFQEVVNNLPFKIMEIISGGAKGADALAAEWAASNEIPLLIFKPEWNKYGRAAGVVRNKLIVESCDYCLVFWDMKSYGTKFSIDYCTRIGKPLRIVDITQV